MSTIISFEVYLVALKWHFLDVIFVILKLVNVASHEIGVKKPSLRTPSIGEAIARLSLLRSALGRAGAPFSFQRRGR